MANKKQPKKKKKSPETDELSPEFNGPWLAKRTGLMIMTMMSLGFTIFIAWELWPTEGWKGILWGLGIGGSLWAIFLLSMGFNKFVRGR